MNRIALSNLISPPTTDNGAKLHGFTRELLATADACDLHISVKPDTDLDDCFKAYCHDTCEMIRVNGWLFTFEEV